MGEPRGLLLSQVGFPASLEVATLAPRCSSGLTPPPQALTFREPRGSYSDLSVHRETWFSFHGKGEEWCILVKHASAFTQANDLAWNLQTRLSCQCARELPLYS